MVGVDPALIDWIGRWIETADPVAPPPILGIAGSQGSGKSTLARAVAQRFGGAALSLDDVYLTQAERAALAERVHPLFAVRGPPGTHDLALLNRLLDRLRAAGPDEEIRLPRFVKLADERAPETDWTVVRGRPRLIVLEGWCLGATAQRPEALTAPVNALEREKDTDGVWRRAVDAALKDDYARLAARLDALVFLKAPGFEVVLDWRCEQEAELLGVAAVSPQRRAALADFIGHYERITRHMLAGGVRPDLTVELDARRRIVALRPGVETA
ncbi:kinase [Brevundimonas sp.]|uniref:kinase n=1 Tax=Brevundimonas sp. TaxID=1871086 RepID=UPI0025BE1106|nr:kinase [Brevundimonas sp.]